MQLMAKMAQQMELFDDGGLMDEGGTTDPVSGNEVPPGSTQEEVRDDIPAQLSEGEFVVPADVVRYIGLENLMRMRQEAKQGLAEMEAMGQMGNSEEAVMPDDLPFDEYDLEVEDDGQDELNFQVGGFVPPSPPNQVNPMTGVYQTGTTGITGYQGYQGQPTGFTPYGGATPFFQPTQFTGPQYTTALQTTNLPTFAETIGSKAGQYDELRTYQNDAGQTLQIPFKNGQPIYPVPEGYKPMADQPVTDTQPTTVTPIMGQAQTRQDTGDGRDDPNVFISGQTKKDFEEGKETNKDRFSISGRRGIDLVSMVPGGNFVRELLGVPEIAPLFEEKPGAIPTGMTDPSNPALSATDDYMKNLSGLPSIGRASDETPTFKPGIGPSPPRNFTPTDVLPASATRVRNLQALRTQLGVSPTRYVATGSNNRAGDFDPASGGFFNKKGIAVNPDTGDAARTDNGAMSYRSFSEYREALAAGTESGWRGGQVGRDTFKNDLTPAQQSRYNDFAARMGLERNGTRSVTQIREEEEERKAEAAAQAARYGVDISTGYDIASDDDPDYGRTGGGGDFDVGRSPDATTGRDAEAEAEDIDPGDFAFKSGGLAKQMKQSGLASKK
tara:strand:+ start:3296 stop:5131 length:1836 start_codon:yes stop_codon:yes gene_type:complete